MIIGIGSDLIDMRRIEQTLARYGKRFVDRIFTAEEQTLARQKAVPAHSYAKRFAAKEACSKALGTGIKKGISFKDMAVDVLPSGQPVIVLTGGAKAHLESMLPTGAKAALHLTITDDYPLAQAFVVIEAIE